DHVDSDDEVEPEEDSEGKCGHDEGDTQVFNCDCCKWVQRVHWVIKLLDFWGSPPKRQLQDAIKMIDRLPRDENNTHVGEEVTARLLDFKTWLEGALALAEAEEEPLPTYTPEEESE
ncbi:hypothetical protein HK104_004379, partial [Borealophlyctis nickersoniae]